MQRTVKKGRRHVIVDGDLQRKRQPRPGLRRQTTRSQAVQAAIKEA